MTMYFEELKDILERIAIALEQISVSMQKDIVNVSNVVKEATHNEAELMSPKIVDENFIQNFLASRAIKIKVPSTRR